MHLPQGYHSADSSKVCKLQKSLYGLKHASRQWFSRLSTFLLSHNFVQYKSDYSLFTKFHGSHFIALLVYHVDDILIASTDRPSVCIIKDLLHQEFKIKDLGVPKFFLDIEIARSSKGIFICQWKYTLDLLEDSGYLSCKAAKTPIEQHQKLSVSNGELLPDPSIYRRLIDRLLYLTLTRADLSYSVHILTQYMEKPQAPHLAAGHRVLLYLKSNPSQGLYYSSTS